MVGSITGISSQAATRASQSQGTRLELTALFPIRLKVAVSASKLTRRIHRLISWRSETTRSVGGVHDPPNGNDIGILVASGRDHRIVSNNIGHNGIGIRVEGDATLHSLGDGSPNNCLLSNTIGFSHAGTAIDLRFENSWWNAANGPSGVGPGDGDSIEEVGTGTVDYEPWLTSKFGSACLPHGIFADGFESGDTSAWSRAVP